MIFDTKIAPNSIFSDKSDMKFINRSYFLISLIFKFLGYLFNNHIIPTISKILTSSSLATVYEMLVTGTKSVATIKNGSAENQVFTTM